jgi:hypothetical protein
MAAMYTVTLKGRNNRVYQRLYFIFIVTESVLSVGTKNVAEITAIKVQFIEVTFKDELLRPRKVH